MKHSFFLHTALLLSLVTGAQAGTFIPAEFESYNTEDLRKITFTGDIITAEWNDGGSNQYEFSSLQRILFTDANGEVTETEKNIADKGLDLLLYPNPVIETLCLRGVPENAEVLMCAANGTTIGMFHSTGNTLEANIANVKSGIYFLKVDGKVVKFIKK